MAERKSLLENIFGFTFGSSEQESKPNDDVVSFVPPSEDGAVDITATGGVYGSYLDTDSGAQNEAELITKYRKLSLEPEVERAIDEIVNDAVVIDGYKSPVSINLDDINFGDKTRKAISKEFDHVLRLLDFSNNGYDIFRRFYVDGRIYYHKMISKSAPREGIKELRNIDPRKIKYVREKVSDNNSAAVVGSSTVGETYKEFFIYQPAGHQAGGGTGLKVSKDSVTYCHSGVKDETNKFILSHLHKAIKVGNQLSMLEDAAVIYRISRAPERRIFYIDVGNLPKAKAEQYLHDMMTKHKNKVVYDAGTGEVRDDRKFMTMMEDFWLPRREGGRGTEITTLPGGQNLGEMEDIEYFKRKLYKSLQVPVSRLEPESGFSLGRASEITREEVKFNRFIQRMRVRFSGLFDDILETQLLLKGVMSREEWKSIKDDIKYVFSEDNHFSELKDAEVLRERMQNLNDVDGFKGEFFSKAWIQKNVLRFTEEEVQEIEQEIEQESGGSEGDEEDMFASYEPEVPADDADGQDDKELEVDEPADDLSLLNNGIEEDLKVLLDSVTTDEITEILETIEDE